MNDLRTVLDSALASALENYYATSTDPVVGVREADIYEIKEGIVGLRSWSRMLETQADTSTETILALGDKVKALEAQVKSLGAMGFNLTNPPTLTEDEFNDKANAAFDLIESRLTGWMESHDYLDKSEIEDLIGDTTRNQPSAQKFEDAVIDVVRSLSFKTTSDIEPCHNRKERTTC